MNLESEMWLINDKKRLIQENKALILDTLRKYVEAYNDKDFSISLQKINDAIQVATDFQENDWILIMRLVRLSLWLHNFGYITKSLKESLELINLLSQKKYIPIRNCVYDHLVFAYIEKDHKGYYFLIEKTINDLLQEIKDDKKCLSCLSKYQSQLYYRNGNIRRYKEIYRVLFNKNDNNSELQENYFYGIASSYLENKKYKKALKFFSKIDKLSEEDNEKNLLGKAKVYIGLEDFKSARKYINKAIKENKREKFPKTLHNIYFLNAILFEFEGEKKEIVLKNFQKAYEYIKGLGYDRLELETLIKIVRLRSELKIDYMKELKYCYFLAQEFPSEDLMKELNIYGSITKYIQI